jgi:hypothetical protein
MPLQNDRLREVPSQIAANACSIHPLHCLKYQGVCGMQLISAGPRLSSATVGSLLSDLVCGIDGWDIPGVCGYRMKSKDRAIEQPCLLRRFGMNLVAILMSQSRVVGQLAYELSLQPSCLPNRSPSKFTEQFFASRPFHPQNQQSLFHETEPCAR